MGTTGHRIQREETGPEGGPLVVLVHGSLDRAAGMARLARSLSDRWRVVRYDRRGYGRAAAVGGPYDVPAHVDDLVEVLAGRPAVVVGHSFGGHVALAASVRVPHLVRAVTVYETPMSWLEWWPARTAGGMAAAADDGDAAEAFMRRLIGDGGWERLPERTRAQRRREGAALRAELLSIRESAPWSEGDISVPVVCGHGSRGSAHHARGMRWLASVVQHGSLVELAGAGHSAPVTHASTFADALVDVHWPRAGISTF